MTVFERYPPAVIEFAATFEALRRLGFPSDDIFFAHSRGNAFAVLRRDGKEFNICCGRLKEPPEQVQGIYRRLAAELPDWTDEELDAVWERSWIRRHGLDLVAGLHAKGIQLPKKPARDIS